MDDSENGRRRKQTTVKKFNIFVFRLVCSDNEDEDCWMNTCEDCRSKKNELQADILRILKDNQIDMVSFIQWQFSDRDQKKTFNMS